MSRNSFSFGVESLEHRLLMAVLPSLPSAASAEYAPPAPHGMMDMDHVGGIAANVAIPATESAPKAVSLSVEHGAASNLLMVQFHDIEQPQLVAVVGGATAWTDVDGAVHFEIAHATRQIELTLANAPYLRISLNADGRIGSYTRLETSSAEAERQGTTIVAEAHAGDSNTIQVGLGIAQFTPTGASAIHHGPSDVILLAPTAVPARMIDGHAGGNHGVSEEFASHLVGANGAMATGSGTGSLMPTDNGQANSSAAMTVANRTERSRAGARATAAQENETADMASSAATGGQAASLDHETVEAVFAGWAGGEEAAAPFETRAMFLVDVRPERSVTSNMHQQSTAPRQAEFIEHYDTEPYVDELDAKLSTEAADIGVWRAAAAFIFSAGCAAGAYALERRAEQAEPAALQPTRVRRRAVRAPSSGSMAKAAM